ncbi:hypothetical protein [Chryseobacterium indologenes]|uniref:C1q domain-containing protein n=1 Tax=Chryseobacterium indologenes TaxID=253 RepID=A0A0N0ZUF5_CHRID|nr:hypothetical protein [Chryseobacterium indologenes]KPE50039.1 hypothetical protein AOB46_16395 [Chryseobacterium indologenes]
MKFRLSFLFFITISALKAQVGIGTTSPDPGAVLDLVSADKGLLIPRVNLQGTTDISTIPVLPADEGLIVYNLNNAGTAPNHVLKDTFYIWADSAWQAFSEIPELQTEITNNNTTQHVFSGNSTGTLNYPNTNFSEWTVINFTTEYYDQNNIHSTGTFTIPETSLYSFSGNIQLAVTGGGGQIQGIRIMNMTDNTEIATSYMAGDRPSGGTATLQTPVHWMGQITAGTQIQIQFRIRGWAASDSLPYTGSLLINKHL